MGNGRIHPIQNEWMTSSIDDVPFNAA